MSCPLRQSALAEVTRGFVVGRVREMTIEQVVDHGLGDVAGGATLDIGSSVVEDIHVVVQVTGRLTVSLAVSTEELQGLVDQL